jgi:hypothetical protein
LPRFTCFDCSKSPHFRHALRAVSEAVESGMIARSGIFGNCTATAALAAGCALFFVASGLTQENRPAADAAPPAQAPASNAQPNFVDAVGRWFEEGAAKFKSQMESAQGQFDKLSNQAREATKGATGTIVGLPNARVITAREKCVKAPNGAPDCLTAAVTLCRSKGFETGKSLDTQSEQKCTSARFLLEGRSPTSTECPTEIFVTRAMCQ